MAREPAENGPLAFALVVLVAAFAATYMRSAPPPPAAADAPADTFSAGRASETLASLVGDGTPHPIGTDANALVRRRIVDRFTTLGYGTEVQTTFACSATDFACGTVNNVLARRRPPGAGRYVLLVSHYDSVAAGPGASDAGVSVAAILEVARALAGEEPGRNPVAFLLTDGEEAGLIGASAFVGAHPLAREVGVVVNLEARGTSGPSVMFETSGENAWLVELLGASLRRPLASSLFYPVYERLPNDTDLTVFKDAGIPGVNFAFIGTVAQYHSPRDDVAHASPATLQHQGENALAIVRALAGADLDRPRSGNAVFFDVLGLGIVRWPAGWTLPLAGAALALVLLATILSWRVTDASIARTSIGLLAWLLAVGCSALFTWKTVEWAGGRGAWPGGATTSPALAVGAYWLWGLGLATLVLGLLCRWSRAAGAWSGAWLGWAAAGVGAAIYVPEASYVLVVPTLVAGLAGLAAVGVARRAPGALAGTLPLASAAVLLMPPAWMLFDALGPPVLPVVAGVIALVATALSPALARGGWLRWALPAAACAAAGLLSWMSFRAPAFSSERPERMNITYFQLAGEPGARWIVSPQSGLLPPSLADEAPFGPEPTAAFPWSDSRTSFVAEIGSASLNEPLVDILERRVSNGRTIVRLHAISPRKASMVALLLPPRRIESVTLDGVEIARRPSDAEVRPSQRDVGRELRRYASVTVPAGGLMVELVVTGTEPVDGYVFDLSRGLPADGRRLVDARPPEASANGQGDVTILARRISF